VLAAVVVSPWLFGSAEPWAYLLMCLLVAVGLAAWLLSLVRDVRPRVRAIGLTASLAGLLAFVGLQALPLPYGLARALSPAPAAVQSARVEAFSQAGLPEFLPPGLQDTHDAAAISASAAATERSFYLLAAYVGAFLALANTLTSWQQTRRAAAVIAMSGFVMAVFGLAQKFSGTSDIYWFHTPRFGGDIFGPFTNRNHFAAYTNMTLGVTLGLLMASSRAPSFQALTTLREKVAWLSTSKGGPMALLAFGAALMAAAVCVSLSRGGISSLAASLGIAGGAAALTSKDALHKRGRIVGAVGLLTVAAVLWLGWQPVVGRLGTLVQVAKDPLGNSRATATLDTVRMFCAAPVLGSGFGTFQHVFPVFQSPSIQFGRWPHAHNDYAQLLAEGGVVGALLALLAGCLFVAAVWRRFAQATAEARLLVAGLAVGILALAVHSLFDFSLHKPAVALLLAALCGMSVAAVHLPARARAAADKGRADALKENQRTRTRANSQAES
jgi:O-antigen ligase